MGDRWKWCAHGHRSPAVDHALQIDVYFQGIDGDRAANVLHGGDLGDISSVIEVACLSWKLRNLLEATSMDVQT